MLLSKAAPFVLVLLTFLQPSESGLLLNALSKGINRLEAIRKTIHEAISDIKHDPHLSILETHFPEAANLLKENVDRVKQCYNSTINGKDVSIFETSLGAVIHEYLHRDLLEDSNVTSESISARVTSLLHAIRSLAIHVLDCVEGKSEGGVKGEDGKKKPTLRGLTKFAKMSAEHIRTTYQQPLPEEDLDQSSFTVAPKKGALGRHLGEKTDSLIVNEHFEVDTYNKKYPEAFDYRDVGAVSPVKDQGVCGLCFLFGIMSAIESSYILKTGTNVTFSIEDMVDCMVKHNKYPGTETITENGKDVTVPSCKHGGSQVNVLSEGFNSGLTLSSQESRKYVRDNNPDGSGPTTANYPFDPENCGKDPIAAKVTGWASRKDIEENDDYLKAVLLKYGPVSTVFRTNMTIDIPHRGDRNYVSAFFNIIGEMHDACDPESGANHVMTIIGWNKDYWIIKNSYGAYEECTEPCNAIDRPWGKDGYLYLEKSLARDCALFGPGSYWYFPQVEPAK